MQDEAFVPHLKNLLAQYRIDPRKLLLEITETVRIDDLDRALALLRELHDLGLSIALDDFGMGYSSTEYLNRLKSLPIDLIKIDRSFIQGCRPTMRWCASSARYLEVLALPVMAEGVESAEQRDWLLKHGIRSGQDSCLPGRCRAKRSKPVLPRGLAGVALPFGTFPRPKIAILSYLFALVQTKAYAIFSFAPRLTRFSS